MTTMSDPTEPGKPRRDCGGVTAWLREWCKESQCDNCAASIAIGDPLARTTWGVYICQKCANLSAATFIENAIEPPT